MPFRFQYQQLNISNKHNNNNIVFVRHSVEVYLLVVKISKIPTRIWPLLLMLLCKIAFSKMSPNICDCIESVVKCQMQCTIEGNNIRSWQQRTLDAVDSVAQLTKYGSERSSRRRWRNRQCWKAVLKSIVIRLEIPIWNENKQWITFLYLTYRFFLCSSAPFKWSDERRNTKTNRKNLQVCSILLCVCFFIGMDLWPSFLIAIFCSP